VLGLAVTGDEPSLEGDGGWPGVSSRIQAACSWFGPSDLNLMDRFPPRNHPAALLMHGAQDDTVPLASSQALYRALIKKGVEASLHVIRTGHHNAYLWGDHHIRLVSEFFDWHLRGAARTRNELFTSSNAQPKETFSLGIPLKQ
jgi:fermentation-respiration switch protein FrsA (DUF1100 family)